MKLLFAGRHLLHTRFQEEYLAKLLQKPVEELDFFEDAKPQNNGTIDEIIFAITSSTHEGSRYNPISYVHRALGVDRFANYLKQEYGLNIRHRLIGIPHYHPTDKFLENLLKEISETAEGELVLAPYNTVVVCSTPELIPKYRQLGFSVLPAELLQLNPPKYSTETPIQLLKKIVEKGDSWTTDTEIRDKSSDVTRKLWEDFPEILKTVFRLYRDPLLDEQGSLTPARQYSVYAFGMGNSDIIDIKYKDIKDFIKPGKIVDEGCADGALFFPIARDFPDSDLIGIEATGEFIARARERQRAGEFGDTYVHFHQRNIMLPIFQPNSIDTTICNSTGHELWSYGEGQKTIDDYLKEKYTQTKKGGRIVIRDVVGPENKEQEVYMWCNDTDDSNNDIFREFNNLEALARHSEGLSTYARFKRFARDYLAEMRTSGRRGIETKIIYREETINDGRFIISRLKDAVEFMTKKDYTANWKSEMNEEFAFWSFGEWKNALMRAGFTVIENPNGPEKGSRAYANPWIVDNRLKGKVELYQMTPNGLVQLEYPVTTMVLVGEK